MIINRRTPLIAATVVATTITAVGLAAAAADTSPRHAATPATTTFASPLDPGFEIGQATTPVASVPNVATVATVPAPPTTVPTDTTDTTHTTDTTVGSGTVAPPVVPPAPAPGGETVSAPPTTVAPEPDDEMAEDGDDVPADTDGVDLPGDPPPPPPIGGPSDLAPVPKPDPPKPTIPGPVDLTTLPAGPDPTPIDDLVAPTDPTPWDGPTDFQVAPLPGYLGDITSGLEGCQLECVTSAILTANAVNANMHLAVEATLPIHIEIAVAEVGGSGGLQIGNAGYDTAWETTLAPLQPDTQYDLELMVIDQDGHDRIYTHRFTTPDVIDGLAGNAKGCALQCLTAGTVDKTADAHQVRVHVESNSPAELQVWVSTSEPTWVNDPATKPAYGPVYDNANPSTSWTFDVPGLQADTTYHIVARAEDGYGVAYRVGTFHTDAVPPVDVLVTFEEILVRYDGDKSVLNKGELSFEWGFDRSAIGWRGEEKLSYAATVELRDHNAAWFTIDPDTGSLPNIMMTGTERDGRKKANVCEYSEYDMPTDPMQECTHSTTNVAQSGAGLTVADIMAMPLCSEFGVSTPQPDRYRCAAFETPDAGDDYARFSSIVSFFVD